MSNSTLRKLTKSNFNRPETTYQDTLQNKKSMMEKLNVRSAIENSLLHRPFATVN